MYYLCLLRHHCVPPVDYPHRREPVVFPIHPPLPLTSIYQFLVIPSIRNNTNSAGLSQLSSPSVRHVSVCRLQVNFDLILIGMAYDCVVVLWYTINTCMTLLAYVRRISMLPEIGQERWYWFHAIQTKKPDSPLNHVFVT